MKNTLLLLLCFFCLCSGKLHAQAKDRSDMIGLVKSGLLIKKEYYLKCDIEMTQDQLVKYFLRDPQMLQYAKPMTIHYSLSKLFAAAGTTLLAFPLFDAVRDKPDPNWTLAYIGGACLAASIPFKIAFKKKAHKAIAYYNSGYQEAPGVSMRLKISPQNMGLVMNF